MDGEPRDANQEEPPAPGDAAGHEAKPLPQDRPGSPNGDNAEMPSTVIVPPSEGSSVLGLRIGRYELREKLGQGGFGEVYRAWDAELERDVAFKFLKEPSEPVSPKKYRKMLKREAKMIAKLSQHPGIVEIHDWGDYNGRAYFVLEYVSRSVHQLLRDRPQGLELPHALRIVVQAAEALEFAHTKGVCHQDIKPENILLDDETGRVKIVDFGLARFYKATDKTVSIGPVGGTPRYMSPEQAAGWPTDHRSDVYSLGTTLYHLLCGEFQVEGATVSEILDHVRNGDRIPIRKWRPELREDIVEVIEKATAFRPKDRFKTAGQFAAACQEILDSIEEHGKEPTTPLAPAEEPGPVAEPSKVSARTTALLLAAIIAALLFGIWRQLTPPGPGPPGGIVYADRLLDSGNAPAAEQAYSALLNETPGDPEALEGLGYALLLQAKYAGAESSFNGIQDESTQTEGLSAVAYYRKDETARQALEQAAQKGASAFPEVLLGTLDLVEQQYDKVVERLEDIERQQVRFGWQFQRCLQTLGQAYYHQDELDNALVAFQRLASAKSPGAFAIANAYVERIQREADSALRESNREAMRDLRKRLDEMQYVPKTDEELWTSRPLRFLILPPDVGKSACAVESGLGDCLPDILGKLLAGQARLDAVGRGELDAVLSEQELTALVGAHGELSLAQLLGARLIIKNSFRALGAEELLFTKVVDTETSRRMEADDIVLSAERNARTVVDEVAERVAAVVADEYPLQGRLTVGEEGPAINVGDAVGVKTGTRFVLTNKPDRRTSMPGAVVTVTGIPATDSAQVSLEGLSPEDIPEGGLYVIEESWYKQHVAGSG